MKPMLITTALIAATSCASAGPIRHEFNVCDAQASVAVYACMDRSPKQECLVTYADTLAACQDKAFADRKANPENW
jgi:hypothetical protein